MADKQVSWAAWGWLTLLGLMLVIPILGVALDQAAVLGSLLFPLLAGTFLGTATLLAAIYIKSPPWWWTIALAAWTLTIVLFHRQLGLLITGAVLGCVIGFFREPIFQAARRCVAWYLSRRNASKLD
ncbi:hypothetical protein [Bremerella cremea]|uniref:hypothetical protein n=1 Tax=Bremerella cremea TaxID=1031537 RepID=UPI0031EDBE2C